MFLKADPMHTGTKLRAMVCRRMAACSRGLGLGSGLGLGLGVRCLG